MESKEIIVIKNGIDYNITETTLMTSFLQEGYIPETDKLLDWRSHLSKQHPNSNFEKELLFKEILATDYLLNKRYEK